MMNTTEIANCNTTNPFLINAALPLFILNPFKTLIGLNDERYSEG